MNGKVSAPRGRKSAAPDPLLDQRRGDVGPNAGVASGGIYGSCWAFLNKIFAGSNFTRCNLLLLDVLNFLATNRRFGDLNVYLYLGVVGLLGVTERSVGG